MKPVRCPANWVVSKFGELIRVQGGSQPPKAEFLYAPKDGYVQLLQIRDFGERPVPTFVRIESVSKFCEKDDVLIARYGASLGRILTGKSGAYNVAIAKTIFDRRLLVPRYVFYYLQTAHFQHPLKMMSRSAQNGFAESELKDFALPVAPLPEQHRIVAKIEELFSELDKGIENLMQARAQLAVYRQALLKHAFEGKLTADWRAANECEPARKQLDRVLRRRDNWQQLQLSQFERANTRPPKDWKRKYTEPELTEHDDRNPMPEGWCWSQLEQLIPPLRDAVKTGPFGSLLHKRDHVASGVPVYGIENVRRLRFIPGPKIHISKAKAEELSGYEARSGDVLISRSGTVGEVCVLPASADVGRISSNLMRVRLAPGGMLPGYFCLVLNGCPTVLNQISELCSGSSRDFLNQEILHKLRLPLPPVPEQQRLLELVEDQLSILDHTDSDIADHLQRSEALRHSILKKAFAGELVPQDPNDEPASVLLARIREERASAVTPPKKPRQRKTPCPAA